MNMKVFKFDKLEDKWKLNTKKRYDVIIADPPYPYRNKKTGGGMASGSSSKYVTMDVDTICELPVRHLGKDNSVLFLWCTVPLLDDAPFRVLRAWGYTYKTALFWRKVGSGGWGFWFRGEVEMLLLGIKGSVKAFRSKRTNLIEHKRIGHSIKPDIFREIIEESTKQFKKPNRLELFARRSPYRRKWDYWGDQLKNGK